jgi:hypothetical protein
MSTFRTERLPLAIFLHATASLPFLRCVPGSNARVIFEFSDPENRGHQMELEFDRGALMPAVALFASQKFLRTQMSAITGGHESRKHGVSNHGYPR